MIYKHNAPQILEQLKKASFPLLICHENPDGDTLGSSLALARFLQKNDKTFKLFCPDKPADYFNFLPGIENLICDYRRINLADHDLIIALDCGDIKRTGIAADLLKIKEKIILINIDHHQSNNHYGHYNLVLVQASSTSEILYNFFNFHKLDIDKLMATSLLTGILTDTMNFTNLATTTDSLKIAAKLLKLGARINQIISKITQNKNLPSLNLWGKLLEKLTYNPAYNFAHTIIAKKELHEYNISMENLDGLAGFLSNLQNLDFILVLSEEDDNLVKGSLRTTKNEIDVSLLAQAFNGGGHAKAAGFKIPKPQNNPDWEKLIINDIINQLCKLAWHRPII